MQTASVSRSVDAPPAAVRDVLAETGPSVRAAGFDEVTVDGSTVEVRKRVGLAELSLTLEAVADPDAAVVHEQREGVFPAMRTTYAVEAADGGSTVTATTEFALDVPVVGACWTRP